ncbi:KilA-N domain-containing protein, partial [Chromatium okenii]|uniref:KilA-N domain-containing protein n=1 Tax=Chromatium okenii TaxID=61644 RepID=UPI0026ED61EA
MSKPFNTPAISISGINIFQDADGRYCLNDLHKAAGGEQRHRPKYWLENQQTIDLIAELSNPLNLAIHTPSTISQLKPIITIKGGNCKQGTYAIKPLAVAYAAWLGGAQFVSRVMLSVDEAFSILQALNEFEVPDDFPDAYVYAIRETNTGNIKLGISRNPESRLRQLQVANSGELELV